MKNLILKLCMCLGLVYLLCGTAFAAEVWDGTVADSFAGGSGTQSDPYLISNGAQLRLVEKYSYYGASHYKLTGDIYLNDTTDWEDWTAESGPDNVWTPLCMEDGAFFGLVDGNGYTIYGLYISSVPDNHEGIGLFSTVSGTLQNISVEKSSIFGNYRVGGIAGAANGNSVIKNCHFGGKITATDQVVGGLVGHSYNAKIIGCTNSGTIYNANQEARAAGRTAGIVGNAYNTVIERCVNTGSISASAASQMGGIAGQAFSGTTIINCENKGTVSALYPEAEHQNSIGGITGFASDNVIIGDCENRGSIQGKAYYVGGIAGQARTGNNGISGCRNFSSVSGYVGVGGIIGDLTHGILDGCVNKGEISGNSYVGGVAGEVVNGLVQNSSNEGVASGDGSYIGGVAGYVSGYSEGIINCRNTGAISGTSCVGGIIGNAIKGSSARNCWNVGTVQVDTDAYWCGMIVGSDNGCTIDHCYGLAGSCGEEPADKEKVPQLALSELKSVEFLTELNSWVKDTQRPGTTYALWEIDAEGYPAPTGTVPDYIPVTGTLTLTQPENGSAVISATSALTEKMITVTVTPNEGYIPYQVWYCAAEEPDAVVYAEKTGKNTFSFPMPYGDAAVHATCLKLPDNPVWDGSVATEFAGGDGTENNPYLIGNASQLAYVEKFDNYDAFFRLIADIYLNETTGWEEWTAENGPANMWTPISQLNGGLDGDGYTIYGLYTDKTADHQGLIRWTNDGCCIKNLTIDQSKIFGTEYVGAFAGSGYGQFENLVNYADIYSTERMSGGLFGNLGDSVMENCANYGAVYAGGTTIMAGGIGGMITDSTLYKCANYGDVVSTTVSSNWGDPRTGGFVGELRRSTISDSQNYGAVSALQSAAGFAGVISTGTIDNCVNYGQVTAVAVPENTNTGVRAGGIAALFYNGVTISNCTNYGTISAKKYVGGIAGYFYANDGAINTIERCVNNGTAFVGMDSECTLVGGIMGYATSRLGGQFIIRDCYNTGNISGNRLAGGLVGQLWVSEADSSAVLETSYNTGLVTAEKYVSGIAGRICANVAGASATVRDCYTLSGVAPATVTCYGGAGRETITNAKVLTAAQMGQQNSFTGFDFDSVWYCAGDRSYPILRGEKVSAQLDDELQVSGYLNCPLTVTADANLSDSCVYVLLVSYKDGKMEDTCMVKLTAGQSGTLDVDDWGTEVRLFALSSTYKPFCNGQTI